MEQNGGRVDPCWGWSLEIMNTKLGMKVNVYFLIRKVQQIKNSEKLANSTNITTFIKITFLLISCLTNCG